MSAAPTLKMLSWVTAAAIAWLWGVAHAQLQDGAVKKLPPVTVTATATRGAVEKSYRKMIAGMDLFERMHHALRQGSAERAAAAVLEEIGLVA